MPMTWRRLPEIHATVMAVEVGSKMRSALGDRVELISESARAIVAQGDSTPRATYLEALREIQEAKALLPALEQEYDVLIAPSALGVAPEGLAFTGDPVMCRPWTALGLPCSTIPAVHRADGLPVGVRVVAPAFSTTSRSSKTSPLSRVR